MRKHVQSHVFDSAYDPLGALPPWDGPPRLHMPGTTSKEGKLPTLYEDLDARDTIVQR
ncbi:hypothetical protein ACFY5F_21870 [Streptomyces sp. NPDC013161]|uniref:hypothetical protein n=1 Tax=Streptomyces sp. NPDC013161 TaxID=3364862 RepID=UPI0036B84B9F